MAIKTQAELEQASNSTYTTNGANAITAALVRTFNTDFISSSIVATMTSSMTVGNAISSSYAATASVLLGAIVSASHADNADVANTAISAPYYVPTASYNADSASFVAQLNTLSGVTGSYAITGSNFFSGSQVITGSTTVRPQYVTTDRPFTITQASDGTSANGNLILARNTAASTTGSVIVSGSLNLLLYAAGISNANLIDGYRAGINGTRNLITIPGPYTSGSNAANAAFPTVNSSIINANAFVTDERPSTATTALTLSNVTLNNALNITTTTGSIALSNSYLLGSLAVTLTGSTGGAKALGGNILAGSATTYIIDSPTAASVLQSSLITGNSHALLSSGSNYNLANVSLQGLGLVVTGSTSTAGGGLYVGKYNAKDSTSLLSNTVFAVGAGTSATVRKTALHVSSSGLTTLTDGLVLTGSLNIQSGSGDLYVYGNKQFNVGAFASNITQSGSANVSQSINFEVTDISRGIAIANSSQITLANSGTYNIQFSIQLLADAGADDVFIWLKKNGTNVPGSAGRVVLANNEELIAAWNYVVEAAANDYYELVWQSSNGDAVLLTEAATGNIPGIPSVILTVTQVR